MIDINKKYRTRDGREVRIYATDGAHGKVHGAVMTNEGWEHRTWNSSGLIVLCQEHGTVVMPSGFVWHLIEDEPQ